MTLIRQKQRIQQQVNEFFILIFAILGIIAILKYPKFSAEGVQIGLNFCSETLIASLFPFMVLSSFIINSGASITIGKLINPITKTLFKLPGSAGATILIGMIGGYPTGARGIKNLLEQNQITEKEARHMMLFTFGAGPAFIISAIGATLLRNSSIGIILFLSHISSEIILGIIFSFFYNPVKKEKSTYTNKTPELSNAIVSSCKDATYGIINMCAFVIIFSAFINILNGANITAFVSSFLSGIRVPKPIADSFVAVILEITSGTLSCIKNHTTVEFISFALGWGGLCVHFQIYNTLENINFSKIKFTLFRFLHGALSYIITGILLSLLGGNNSSQCISIAQNYQLSSSMLSKSLTLICLCICFISSITPSVIKNRS